MGALIAVIVNVGAASVVVRRVDDLSVSYPTERRSAERWVAPVNLNAQPTRAIVELLRKVSGNPQSALIGAEYAPNDSGYVELVMTFMGDWQSGRSATYDSPLWSALVPGLVSDYAPSIREGLFSAGRVPSGVIMVDRAAYHEVDSSYAVFRDAADLLGHVIAAGSVEEDVEEAVRSRLRAWQDR